LEQATGTPLAENMKQFITTGKPEMVAPVLDRMISGYSRDPNQTIDNLLPILTSPLTSAQTIGQISRDLGDVAAQESITGPTSNPRRDKFAQRRTSIERQIAGLETVTQKYGHTKAGEVAMKKIEQLRGQLDKMETVLSGAEATQLGVRPGTTLTETGSGNIGVLQGPDDSGEGGSGGLKATDERALKSFIDPEFADEVNLETGAVRIKTTEDAAKARQTLARAARIYSDAGGRLTLSEAADQALRESGALGSGGGDPYDQFNK
jgi:hypothetical protein